MVVRSTTKESVEAGLLPENYIEDMGYVPGTMMYRQEILGEVTTWAGLVFDFDAQRHISAGDYDLDWHPAPRRQYIINLDNGVEITASDGETRVIGAGEVLLVEDTTGKGHLSKAINERVRNCIFVALE
jgi:hypothetical protein